MTTRVDTTEIVLPVTNSSIQSYPSATVDSAGNVYVAYSRLIGYVDSLSLLVATSLDGGNSFRSPCTILEIGSNNHSSMCVDATAGLDLLWVGNNGTFFSRSTDTGQAFSEPIAVGGGLADVSADSAGNLFTTLDTQRRAIKFAKTNVIAAAKDLLLLPESISLSQNYPNPFNPTTTMNYDLPVGARVTLKVYDVLGKEVATMVDGFVEAGYHHAVLNAATLASGVYFYRLQSGNFVSTKKLLLLR